MSAQSTYVAETPRPTLQQWRNLLPLRTMVCPKDGAALHWEVFGGMRLRQDGIYRTVCPSCRRNFNVLAHKDTQ